MTSATRGGGSVRGLAARLSVPAPFVIAAPPALLLAALGMVVGAAAGVATCMLWGLV